MPKISEIYQCLEHALPASLSCDWDNDGLMVCASPETEVKKILFALDITPAVADYAAEIEADLVISHHPLIFSGIRRMDGHDGTTRKVISLLRNNISAMSFHTRLDAVAGGVNDTLCRLLGIGNPEPFGEEGIGRIGSLSSPMSAEAFARLVKERLNAPAVFFGDAKKPVCRVAVLGGAGGDDIGAARQAGADTYLSGTLGYHDMTDAPEAGMNLLEAGHFFTEQPVTATLEAWLLEIDPTLSVEQFYSNTVKTV